MNALVYAARPLLEDFISTLVFVVLIALKVDVRVATSAAIAVGVVHVAWKMLRGKPVAALEWLSLGLVLVFGTASLITHDPRFVMVKPSIIYGLVGAAMLRRGWMLRYMPPVSIGHGEDLMVAFGYVWAGLMFVSAVANAVVAVAYADLWPGFIAVFPLASKGALFAVQFAVMRTVVRRRILAAA